MKTLLSFFRIRLSCPGLSGIGILRVRNPGIRFYGGWSGILASVSMADAAAGFRVDSFRPASRTLVLSLQEELALIVVVISACGWPMFPIPFTGFP